MYTAYSSHGGVRRPSSDLCAPCFLGDSVVLQVPCVVHHQLEVVVAVDAHRHVVVVLDPLARGDGTVLGVLRVVRVVLLEGVDELVEDLVLRLLSRLDIWVHLGVVSLTDVVDLKLAAIVNVHDLERLHAHALAEVVHGAADTSQELVVVDGAGAVAIEDLEELGALGGLQTDTEIVDGLLEFLHAEVTRAIVVRNLKGTTEAHDATIASLGELLTEAVHELGLCHVHGGNVGVLSAT